MGTAYTPGLTISADTVIRKVRRLPLKGQVLVQVGDQVDPDTVLSPEPNCQVLSQLLELPNG